MNSEYNVVAEFSSTCKDNETIQMVVVQDERGACVMPMDEWKWIYGRQHMSRWKK